MDKIILYFKGATIKEMPLVKDTTTIGRKPENDLVIDNLAVSGFHAKIVKEGGQVLIEDLNSLNGTYVNEKKIARCILRNKDKIIVGKHSLVFMTDRPEPHGGAETSQPDRKDENMERTMVLDTKQHKAMAAADPDAVLGGFLVIEGSADQADYELKARLTTIGKTDTAVIKLKGLLAPKVAALVNRTKDGYFIAPPGSGGGKIKINGNNLVARTKLKDGDVVEVHNLKLQFYVK